MLRFITKRRFTYLDVIVFSAINLYLYNGPTWIYVCALITGLVLAGIVEFFVQG